MKLASVALIFVVPPQCMPISAEESIDVTYMCELFLHVCVCNSQELCF